MARTIKPYKVVLLAALSLNLVFAAYLTLHKDRVMRLTAQGIVKGAKSDDEKALRLLDFVYGLQFTAVGNNPVENNYKMAGLTGVFYGMLPINLIPSDVVLKYGIVYTGPCGAKSRLLFALLDALGLKSHLASLHSSTGIPTHTLVEVYLGRVYTPIDPTYNLYVKDGTGDFAATSEVCSADEINIVSHFPVDVSEYRSEFCYVTHFAIKDLVISLLRVVGVINRDYSNAEDIMDNVDDFIPQAVIDCDYQDFNMYSDIRDLYLVLSLAVILAVCCAFAIV